MAWFRVVRCGILLSCHILSLNYSMASPAQDSHSDDAKAESSPQKSHGDSPELQAQSDQPGPADSEEDSEVYEIEAILDAKRGATGSVSSCKHTLAKKTRLMVPLVRLESATSSNGKDTRTRRIAGSMNEMPRE